ncbi:MAG: FtsX-like permease family protein [Acidimicrobiia bacterium]
MTLWLRWSWRDLRARWLQVAAIAMIIALGSGVYSGLGSGSAWRRLTYDRNYAQLHMYDLRIALSSGNYVGPADLVETIRSIPQRRMIRAVEPRLIGPTQVDASRGGETILVPGRVVGVDTAPGPHVNAVHATKGRGLRTTDDGKSVVVLDEHFAKHYHLPDSGTIRVSKGPVEYVGQGLSPEYFMITSEEGGLLAEANFAVVFTSLRTAQGLLDRPNQVNDAVVTFRKGANVATVRREIGAAMKRSLPDVGFTTMTRRDERSYRTLYDDIENDQQMFTIFALLILLGAAFAAFNLTGRIVEAQRREIGIGMALGVPPRTLAVRPVLVGVQVALFGVVFGLGVGYMVQSAISGLYASYQPMPTWYTPFQADVFLRGAALGLLLPFVATLLPVRRAVRVAPVDAIRTGFLSTRSGLAPLLARVRLPGNSLVQMPVRNVFRAPRRTVLTLLGISAAITVMVSVVGMVDSFVATIDSTEHELLRASPHRVTATLDRFSSTTDDRVRNIADVPVVERSQPGLSIGGRIRKGSTSIDVLLDMFDFDGALWTPGLRSGTLHSDRPALVISEKAAGDLHVRVGDTVSFRHPYREGLGYRLVTTEVPIVGIDRLPTRPIAFMDRRFASLMNLDGIVNVVAIQPKPGVSENSVKRELFGLPGVASAQPISAYTGTIRKALQERMGILDVVEYAVLLLALLIAFNSTSISVDERMREQATMFAFGVPVRSVMTMTVAESVLTGTAGTLLGIALGRGVLEWLMKTQIPQVLPDLGIDATVSNATLATAVALGVVAVAVAPLFTLRKLRRMDVPSTLRVME